MKKTVSKSMAWVLSVVMIFSLFVSSASILAGTSLTVYPAAGLLHYFRGGHLVLINRDATPMDASCDLIIRDKVGQVLGNLT